MLPQPSPNLVVFVILSSFNVCNSVRLLGDSVIPPHALRGHQAVLRCNYDLEGDSLYSVKWYFNQKEFYRYIPTDNPRVTIFNHHKGVKVNARLSTEREVVLDDVDFRTTGQYRCEVSGDAPMFQTASKMGILYVVELPEHGPVISGGHPRYNIGDRVNVTCTSRNSVPAAQLAWYINAEKADPVHLRQFREETTPKGLKTSRLGLIFKVRQKHFKQGDLKLKCTATISTVYWRSNEESVQGSGFNAHTAPVSESKGRTSVALRFLLAAATSHITGGATDGLGFGSTGFGFGNTSGACRGPSSNLTLISVLFLIVWSAQHHRHLSPSPGNG